MSNYINPNLILKMKKFNSLIFIDDDELTNIYHQLILKSSEICDKAKFFLSAEKAIEYIQNITSDKTETLPDVIFLDINMPAMNGWEFVDLYEKLDINNKPAIVMLSSSNHIKDLELSASKKTVYKLINKPLQLEELKHICSELT